MLLVLRTTTIGPRGDWIPDGTRIDDGVNAIVLGPLKMNPVNFFKTCPLAFSFNRLLIA